MRLNAADSGSTGQRVHHIRLDLVGRTGDSELWWVARQFEDGTRQPEGMFTNAEEARKLADTLAASFEVEIVVKDFTA